MRPSSAKAVLEAGRVPVRVAVARERHPHAARVADRPSEALAARIGVEGMHDVNLTEVTRSMVRVWWEAYAWRVYWPTLVEQGACVRIVGAAA